MRHRRRTNTQTIQRKSRTNARSPYASKPKTRRRWPFYIIILTAIASAGYFYQQEITEFFKQPSAETTTPVQNKEVVAQQPEMPTATNNENVQYYSPIEKRIQLEILNGCGEKGVAKKLAALLKKDKYDIVNSGNYMEKGKINWDVADTKIIDQVNQQENARDLADAIGVLYAQVESYDNPSPIADITIVIGKDYKDLLIFK